MNDFYDLKYFFSFFIRKIKIYIVIILLVILGVVGTRAVSLFPQYLEGRNQEQKAETKSSQTDNEPVYKYVTLLLRIEPKYENVESTQDQADVTQYIVSSYVANMYNDSVVQSLTDEYLAAEEKINLDKRNDLYSYGYILDKERTYPYTQYDFMKQLIVETVQPGNYIKIGFSSFSRDSAEVIAERYEQLLTIKIKEQLGEFQCEVKDKSINYVLPIASAGASPNRNANNNVTVTSETAISLGTMVKQLIKGAVWGGMLGFIVGLLLLAAWYFTTNKIQSVSDVEALNANLIGTYISKKKWLYTFLIKWAHAVEGGPRVFESRKDIAKVTQALLESEGNNRYVLISGSGNKAELEEFVSGLGKEYKGLIKASDFILSSVDTILEAKKADCVILIEKMGKAAKKEIEAEIKMFESYDTSVLGVVISE